MAASPTLPLIMTPPAAASAHACCSQRTVTVPPSVNAATSQKHQYGTAQWRASFNRRNRAEAVFADLKGSATTDAKRDSVRVMGLTRMTILSAFWIAANNLRVHDRWQHRQAAAAGPVPATKPARRRTRTLAQLTAPTAATANAPPP